MRLLIDRIEEEVAIMEKEDGSYVHLEKTLIPPEAKEGDVIFIAVDTSNSVDRQEELVSFVDQLWKSDGEER